MERLSWDDDAQRARFIELFKNARFLLWPSESYETFGLVAIEAFACGLPVIATRNGVMAEIVKDRETGLLFTSGDARELAETVQWAWNNPRAMREFGCRAREVYESMYTEERNYELLMSIYDQAKRVA